MCFVLFVSGGLVVAARQTCRPTQYTQHTAHPTRHTCRHKDIDTHTAQHIAPQTQHTYIYTHTHTATAHTEDTESGTPTRDAAEHPDAQTRTHVDSVKTH